MADEDNFTPTQELMMEVLAARWRLGEKQWPFRQTPAEVSAANNLSLRGYITRAAGPVSKTFNASLTAKGVKTFVDRSYTPQVERDKTPQERLRDIRSDLGAIQDRLRDLGKIQGTGYRGVTRELASSIGEALWDLDIYLGEDNE